MAKYCKHCSASQPVQLRTDPPSPLPTLCLACGERGLDLWVDDAAREVQILEQTFNLECDDAYLLKAVGIRADEDLL